MPELVHPWFWLVAAVCALGAWGIDQLAFKWACPRCRQRISKWASTCPWCATQHWVQDAKKPPPR